MLFTKSKARTFEYIAGLLGAVVVGGMVGRRSARRQMESMQKQAQQAQQVQAQAQQVQV